jgi:hypothetical protein
MALSVKAAEGYACWFRMIVGVIKSADGAAGWDAFKATIQTEGGEYAGVAFDAGNPEHQDEFEADLERMLNDLTQLNFLDVQYKRRGTGKLDLPHPVWTLKPKGTKLYERGAAAQRRLFLSLMAWQQVKAIYEPIKIPIGMAGTAFTIAKLAGRWPDIHAVLAALAAATVAILWGIFRADHT